MIRRSRAAIAISGFLLAGGAAVAQQYVISTYAGAAPPPTPVAALNASYGLPRAVTTDAAGNVYFSSDLHCVFKVDLNGILTRVAGNSRPGYSGDGGPATDAQLLIPEYEDWAPGGLAMDSLGNLYIADFGNNRVRRVSPDGIITTVAGNGSAGCNGQFGTELAGVTVSFNEIAATVLYASATQVAAVVPYAITGTTVRVAVAYQDEVSNELTLPIATAAPGLFTLNQTGAGHAAAINAADGTANTAANPAKIGGYISLYATGEGETAPAGVDGRIAGSTPARQILPVKVTVGGIPAPVQYAGGAPGLVAGVMQVNVQIPDGVQAGGYVPVVVQVGDRASSPAVWIAVRN